MGVQRGGWPSRALLLGLLIVLIVRGPAVGAAAAEGMPLSCQNGVADSGESDVDCGGPMCAPCGAGQRCAAGGDCDSAHCDAATSSCLAPTCHDRIRNGVETSVDCGGGFCDACQMGDTCVADSDCVSRVCTATTNTCAAALCSDGVLNGDETSVDCGGPTCPSCSLGATCAVNADCGSATCCRGSRVCCAPSCADGRLTANEAGIDCGGACPDKCADGISCQSNADCISNICATPAGSAKSVCMEPTCTDGAKNGLETAIDCGGNCATGCPAGQACLVNADCGSKRCDASTQKCLAAACNDGIQNGGESAIDCGGSCPLKCGNGYACNRNADCASNSCSASTQLCIPPTCTDLSLNGGETGVDCGGPCSTKCATGVGCATGSDCANGICDATTRSCVAPTCSDGVKNGAETDIDCGGMCNSSCGTGAKCSTASDCQSAVCSAITRSCAAPTCTDRIRNGGEPTTDCGGPCTLKCADQASCLVNADCQSGVCSASLKICRPANCNDRVRNGLETDVDCGGQCTTKCVTGQTCLMGADCLSTRCDAGKCAAGTCTDGIKSDGEMGTDCGGPCQPCAVGTKCLVNSDCVSGVCSTTKICAAPTCTDGVRNGGETDTDCGGGSCAPCASGKGCSQSTDCSSGLCAQDRRCAVPSCTDGLLNGDEAAIDCGGSCAQTCATGSACRQASDCASGVCDSNRHCAAPSCHDTVRNGDEAAVDCGGWCSAPCAAGQTCVVAGDCVSAVCSQGRCQPPTCSDGVRNGGEVDTDCGATCPMGCLASTPCSAAADCSSGVCSGSPAVCQVPTCSDRIRNGDETSVDCGGTCSKCADGATCAVAADCVSLVCSSGKCASPSCGDQVRNGNEIDVDCGGNCATKCGNGQQCLIGGDCVSRVCKAGTCAAPSCVDAVRNGNESDVDCGGSCGATCAPGSQCATAADCTQGVCSHGQCQQHSCSDGVQNGDESWTDCGGSCSRKCSTGSRCRVGTDCDSGVCDAVTGACAAASCSDHVRNGQESDVDCGATCPVQCAPSAGCRADADCSSHRCDAARSVCNSPTCHDGVRNADETDVDCGGRICAPCGGEQQCQVGSDCSSGLCTAGRCALASCSDNVQNGGESDVDCGGGGLPLATAPEFRCGFNSPVGAVCGDGQCCSAWGYCGGGPGFCSGSGDSSIVYNCTVGSVCPTGSCCGPSGICSRSNLPCNLTSTGSASSASMRRVCPKCSTGHKCSVPSDCSSGTCVQGRCVAATCSDGIRNGDEADVDCGGAACSPCGVGKRCAAARDCASQSCGTQGSCLAATCTDGLLNGQESDQDCGGASCNACADTGRCVVHSDCQSLNCQTGHCTPATCRDAIRNAGETDVDCGGPALCNRCGTGKACTHSSDCDSGLFCNPALRVCALPTCADGVRNGNETGVDCGGSTCASCRSGEACVTSRDCQSRVCTNSKCAAASCFDGVQNGNETAADCGGPSCSARCAVGVRCFRGSDCASGVCSTSQVCMAATCSDGVRNGDETSVDCGGAVCGACRRPVGASCAGHHDCATSFCASSGTCGPASCTNNVLDGQETGVDCGGSCSLCAVGIACRQASDCSSSVCSGGVCQSPSCVDGIRNGVESDVDCGGAFCSSCAGSKRCTVAADCTAQVCNAGVCIGKGLMRRCYLLSNMGGTGDTAPPPACVGSDTLCGGACPTACAAGKKCEQHQDCRSGDCAASKKCGAPVPELQVSSFSSSVQVQVGCTGCEGVDSWLIFTADGSTWPICGFSQPGDAVVANRTFMFVNVAAQMSSHQTLAASGPTAKLELSASATLRIRRCVAGAPSSVAVERAVAVASVAVNSTVALSVVLTGRQVGDMTSALQLTLRKVVATTAKVQLSQVAVVGMKLDATIGCAVARLHIVVTGNSMTAVNAGAVSVNSTVNAAQSDGTLRSALVAAGVIVEDVPAAGQATTTTSGGGAEQSSSLAHWMATGANTWVWVVIAVGIIIMAAALLMFVRRARLAGGGRDRVEVIQPTDAVDLDEIGAEAGPGQRWVTPTKLFQTQRTPVGSHIRRHASTPVGSNIRRYGTTPQSGGQSRHRHTPQPQGRPNTTPARGITFVSSATKPSSSTRHMKPA